ncbi:MAG TPA: hypothetical protein VGR92_12060 [Steroidobacteraceae bacterium]|nr:hypothetical protein [Steroidobacteraceae bacterium]
MQDTRKPDPPAGPESDKSPADLTLDLYKLLLPYSSDFRSKAVKAAMTLLGEASALGEQGAVRERSSPQGGAEPAGDFAELPMGPKALRWAQKHGITRTMLEEVFHMSGGMDIIANSIPGSSRREMTVNCYLLTGIRGLLISDIPMLEESEAIAVCKRMTAYDKNNHTANRNAVGNRMSGSKPRFTLTGPGEAAAAELIRRMTAASL